MDFERTTQEGFSCFGLVHSLAYHVRGANFDLSIRLAEKKADEHFWS